MVDTASKLNELKDRLIVDVIVISDSVELIFFRYSKGRNVL